MCTAATYKTKDFYFGRTLDYEFSCGEQSGWMYEVNGVYPGKSCSKYDVEDGDIIKWNYTCKLGKDLEGE